MALNAEYVVSSTRSILRGEAPGSVRLIAAVLAALTVWTGVLTVRNWTVQSAGVLSTQQVRFRTLLTLGNEYRAVAPAVRNTGEVDVAGVFAEVSERMKLGSRVNRISPDGRNQAVEINRLYAEEFAELQRELSAEGVRFIAAELRALPAGNERLFTVSAIIGPVN